MSKCSPADDMVERKNGTCRMCRACDSGKGRNLTKAKQERESLDNTKCLPCEDCPEGTLNDQSHFTNECRPCSIDKCASLNRDVQRPCRSTDDSICGSCKQGYKDVYLDVNHMCEKKETVTATSVHGPAAHVDLWVYMVPTLVVLGLILMCVFLIWLALRRRNIRPFSEAESDVSSSGSSLIYINEAKDSRQSLLETDGPTESRVGTRLAQYKDPHPELASCSVHIPESTFGGKPVRYSNGYQSLIFDKKCSCHQEQCSEACRTQWSTDENRVDKDGPLLKTIAYKICHEPDILFQKLEIPDYEVYNLENDRQRAPDKCSQREFINKVLQRWVELKGREATYCQLCDALCKAGYHRINSECFVRP